MSDLQNAKVVYCNKKTAYENEFNAERWETLEQYEDEMIEAEELFFAEIKKVYLKQSPETEAQLDRLYRINPEKVLEIGLKLK